MRASLCLPVAVLLFAAAPPPASGPASAVTDDLDSILQQAKKTQKDDTLAWVRYRFRRRSVREILDEADQVQQKEDLESLVTPGFERFDERLVRIDGKEPTPGEVKRHRHQGPFNKHYDTLVSGAEGDEAPDGYSLALLLDLSDYRYAGREVVEGTVCHRIDFFPQTRTAHKGLAGKVTEAMAGSLWITAKGFHLARAEAATVQPVSFVLSLARLRSLKVRLEGRPVGDEVWLPRRVELVIDMRVLVKTIHKRSVVLYSDFEPFDPGTTAR